MYILFVFVLFFLIQQAHIPASIMVVLEGEKKPEPTPVEPAAEKEVTDGDREFFLTHLCLFIVNDILLLKSRCLIK